MATQTVSQLRSTSAVGSRRLAAGAAAMLLGSVLLFAVGFAPLAAVHNAAHDTRHSAGFPCH